jgi:hypothetical protein
MGVYPLGKAATPETVVAVDPAESNVTLGQTFSVNVNITDVTGLLGYDFELSYNTTVLTLVGIQEGPFLKSVGPTFLINLTTEGVIWLADALYSPSGIISSVNGSGVLATATFKAVAAGESSLDLYSENPYEPNEVKLASDPPKVSVAAIPNLAISGIVVVSSDPAGPPNPPTSPPLTAYAVIPKTVVGQGYGLAISVTTANQGDLTETFNLTIYANTSEIGELTLTLSNGSSTTVTFVWNTDGFAYGNYTISAYALPTSGETNTANNNLTGGPVTVTIPGDVDGSGRVDMNDIISICKAFGSTVGQPNYNPNCDIENTGKVDMSDVVIALRNFGQHFP